jgi:hypothetical protein
MKAMEYYSYNEAARIAAQYQPQVSSQLLICPHNKENDQFYIVFLQDGKPMPLVQYLHDEGMACDFCMKG